MTANENFYVTQRSEKEGTRIVLITCQETDKKNKTREKGDKATQKTQEQKESTGGTKSHQRTNTLGLINQRSPRLGLKSGGAEHVPRAEITSIPPRSEIQRRQQSRIAQPMPSVIGSPPRQYTPPSSNDESGVLASFSITSAPRPKSHNPTSSSSLNLATLLQKDQSMSTTPASPPSSSEDSPTTSAGDNMFLRDDAEMLDYDDYSHPSFTVHDESSPDALFFEGNKPRVSSRFTSTEASPAESGFSPFAAGLTGLKPQPSPEFDADADSPGLGAEMKGLKLNSRYPSLVQGTVRLEDVMLPIEDSMSAVPAQSVPRSLFDQKPAAEHVETGLFQSPPYALALVGIAPEGAKSRVETQIKLDLQLLHHGTNDLVKDTYDYLKLPSYGVSKEKFRLSNLKDIPKDIDTEKLLHLEASVVCTTQPTKTVFICEGCILRERKRALRKKDYKRKTNKRPPPSPPIPTDENQKIIVFNCPEVVDFSQGTCSLPTRITCYCRHHKEKQGFKVVLVVKDSQGNLIGQCISGNIMITDDHKAQQAKGETEHGSKRRSSEEGGRTSGFTSRRSSMDSVESATMGRKRKMQMETSSATTPQLPTPPMSSTPVNAGPKLVKIPRNLSMTKLKMEPMTKQRASPYPTNPTQTFMRTQSMDSVPTFFGNTTAQAITPSNAGRWQSRNQQASLTAPSSRSNSPPDMLFSAPSVPLFEPQTPFSGIQSAPVSNAASPEDTTFPALQQRWQLDSLPGITIPAEIESPRPITFAEQPVQQPLNPIITKIIPAEGPTTGGIEVTILGQDFTQGIVAQFGEVAAIPTECYSPSTLVCILPPSPTPGPVFVTLRNRFGRPLMDALRVEQQQLFTYVNTTDRALMELALQIMGFKMLGKLEDARNVAAMIIGSNHSGSTPAQDVTSGSGLENTLLRVLDVIDTDTSPHPARLGQRAKTGHTMLHFAAMAGMRRLVAALLVRGVNPAIKDRAGFTALHYATWLGRSKVVQRLLSSGDNGGLLTMKTLEGKTPEDLAVEMGRTEICQLLNAFVQGTLSRASSVASLVSSLSRASLDDYLAGSEWDESIINQSEVEDDDDLWLGSLRSTSSEASTPIPTPPTSGSRRGFLPHRLQLPLPDAQTLNPALYVAALHDLLQPYLQALRPSNPDQKLPPLAVDESPSSDERKYDHPPPAYSELYPAISFKSQFSLATRLSLRGRSFLRWTGMAGDAGLSPEEIEFLKREDGRQKARKSDYMLFAFWIPVLVCILVFTLVKAVNVFRGIGGMPRDLPVAKIVEVHE